MAEDTVDTTSGMSTRARKRTGLVDFGRRLVKEKQLGAVMGVITLILLLVAIFADLIAPYGMNETRVVRALARPSAGHLLGGDQLRWAFYRR